MIREIVTLVVASIVAFGFFGCSSKQYFEPEKSFSASGATKGGIF